MLCCALLGSAPARCLLCCVRTGHSSRRTPLHVGKSLISVLVRIINKWIETEACGMSTGLFLLRFEIVMHG